MPFGRTADGAEFDLSSAKCRGEMLARYSAVEDRGVAFCQMCGKPRRHAFMEVNAIELKPEYYWRQMRLCLCLECSKRFELLRNDEMFRTDFFRKLRSVDLGNLRDNVRVRMPLCGGEVFEVVFTRAHISEIREILGVQNGEGVDCEDLSLFQEDAHVITDVRFSKIGDKALLAIREESLGWLSIDKAIKIGVLSSDYADYASMMPEADAKIARVQMMERFRLPVPVGTRQAAELAARLKGLLRRG